MKNLPKLMKNPHKVAPQLIAAIAAAWGFFCTGLVRGWSSPGVPSLIESHAITNLTADEAAWIASLPPLCALFGSLGVGFPMQIFGRRKTLIMIAIPFFSGFMLMGFSYFVKHKAMLFIGRIVSGTMNGAVTPVAQIYVSECSSPRVRGTLGTLTAIFLAFGILVAYIIGAFVEWHVLAWILGCFPLVLAASMVFMPETPAWLMTNKQEEEARKSLQRLRGKRTNIEAEYQRLKENVNKNAQQPSITPRELIKGSVLKPLGISVALMFFQQFTGINAMVYYTVTIFQDAGSTIDRRYATIIVGFVQLICTGGAAFLVDRFGRRFLLFVSASVVSLSLAAMGAYFKMKELWGAEQASASLGWLPLLSLIVFFIFYSAGFSNVPFLIMGELFPARYRNILGSISSCTNLTFTFIVVRCFPLMQIGMGKYGAFWFFMSCTLVSIVFVYFFLPETKGKTLEDIEKIFSKKFNKDGTPAVPPSHVTAANNISVIAIPNELSQTKVSSNGHVNHSFENDVHKHQQLSLEPIDSEDEEEDDQVPVPTPL